MSAKPKPEKFPVPVPGALDQPHEFTVSLRVRLSGKEDIVRGELRGFLDRELPLHLPHVEITRIKKVS